MSEEQLLSSTSPANTQPKALRVVAGIVSWICHPVFFPLVMAYVLYKLAPAGFEGVTPKQLGLWFISIGITAVFFPLFSIALMKPLGFMSSMIFYFWISHVFNSLPGTPVPLILKVLFLGNLWGIIVLFMINIFTKISMHTAAAGGMIGSIIVLMMTSPVNMILPLFVAIAIAGVVGTARMILGAHQRGDIWLGYIVGILVQLGAYVYMK